MGERKLSREQAHYTRRLARIYMLCVRCFTRAGRRVEVLFTLKMRQAMGAGDIR
jgi:hypothetical protein